MEQYDEHEIHNFLLHYKVITPDQELVNRTKHLMRQEAARRLPAGAWQKGWLYALVSISIVMSLSIFYTLTIGTILSFTLPPYMMEFLRQSVVAFTAAGGCFMAGLFMIFFFKQLECSQVRPC